MNLSAHRAMRGLAAAALATLVGACSTRENDSNENAFVGPPTRDAQVIGGSPGEPAGSVGGQPSPGGQPSLGGQPAPGGQPAFGGDPSQGGTPALGGTPGAGGATPVGGSAGGDPGPCAQRAPDANGGCPATIYEARREIGLGVVVSVQGVVTAIRRNDAGAVRNIVVQVGADQAEFAGPADSGLWVFMGDTTAPADIVGALEPGLRVTLTGETSDFFGQRQLAKIGAVGLNGAAATPMPLVVDAAAVALGGAQAAGLEGALVRVTNADVTNAAPEPGTGDRAPTYEVEIAGGLRVDDFFYRLEPLPAVGETLPRVDGVLRLANGVMKLEPRDAGDIERGVVVPPPPPPPPPSSDPGTMPGPVGEPGLVISEIDYDQDSSDTAEFVEVYNASNAAVALDPYTLELVNGANGGEVVYATFALSSGGASLAPGGVLVVGVAGVLSALPGGVLRVDLGGAAIQNGTPDGVRLIGPNGRRVDGLAYEGPMPMTGEGAPMDGDSGGPMPESLARCLNRADTNDNLADFARQAPSPGVAQTCP